jgi:hypothetical protein
MDPRFSIASSTASMPRYRTVESWVGQQTVRVEDQKMADQLREQIEEAIQEVNNASSVSPTVQMSSPPLAPMTRRESEDTVPSISNMATKFMSSSNKRIREPSLPPCPPAPGVPDKDEKDEEERRKKHVTQGSDAPIFRAHPGTEVHIPRSTFIPSEILDGKIPPNAF